MNTQRFDASRALLRAISSAFAAGALLLGACQTPPRAQVDPRDAIGEATGLEGPIEIITVGPDGGPIDEPGDFSTLSMAEAVKLAVTTDPGLQAALARVRIALADADQARLLPNPVLSVIVRWGPGKPQIEASLAQELIQALQIPKRASAADNRLRQVAAEAVTVAIDLVAEVQDRYVSAQAWNAQIPLLRERVNLLQKIIEVAQSRLEAGESRQSDLTILHAQRVELQIEIDQTALAEREERLRLARLIGQPSTAATWTLDPWSSPNIDLGVESLWIARALSSRPEIQALTWKMRALGDDEALLSLFPWNNASTGLDAQRDTEWFAGPSASTPLPVFDTGAAHRDRITAEQYEARHELTLARRKIVEDVRVAYQTMASSLINLTRIHGELVPLQKKRLEIAENAFRAGQSDATELYFAQQELRNAQARAFAVERQAAIAMVRLQRAVGGPGVANEVLSAHPAISTHQESTSVPEPRH